MRHAINLSILVGIALATRIELLPVLAAVYVLTSGSQWLSGYRRLQTLRAENRDLRGSPTPTLNVDEPNHRRLRRSGWWLPAEVASVTWSRLVLNPLWRWVDAGDPRPSRGRHATHRWETGQIVGTVAQRRPSAAAGQRAVHEGWRRGTGEQPAITDRDIHVWMAEGVRDAIART